jgi:anti-sigma regulatory factor (Ser/Thr protein kinase)
VRTSEIAAAAGVSRTYAHRVLEELRNEGRIVLVGKTNRAHYVLATEKAVRAAKRGIRRVHRNLRNVGLAEDQVFDEIVRSSGIFLDLPVNVLRIVRHAFTEMLNNAIEHSKSERVRVMVERDDVQVRFRVEDAGVGIFHSLQEKFLLPTELDAINHLLKGKQTTAPAGHSGEGIFFTSKLADLFTIRSGPKLVRFDNLLPDVFVQNLRRPVKGTQVAFAVAVDAKRTTEEVFRAFTSDAYTFDTTQVRVRLYRLGASHVSRSQARRLALGLEGFRTVIFDFADVDTVGQAFADELLRVWRRQHPEIRITVEHANENVQFMIDRARSGGELHIVPHGDGWAVLGEGGEGDLSHHETQRAAIERASEIAKGRQAGVVIHGRDGRIREHESYGGDPNPPKDTQH